jgi:hypothetical protein
MPSDEFDCSWLRAVDPDAYAILNRAYENEPEDIPHRLPKLKRAHLRQALPERFPYTPHADTLRGIAIIDQAAWRFLKAHGWLGPYPRHDLWDRHAYDWLRWRMTKRLPNYTGRYPFWFWALRESEGLARDYEARHFTKGRPAFVVLWLTIPREAALMSDFQHRHMVLNCDPPIPNICPDCGKFQCLDCRWEKQLYDDTFLPNPKGRKDNAEWQDLPAKRLLEISNGWDAIFDESIWDRIDQVQAVTEFLRAEWVTNAWLCFPEQLRRDWH